MPNERKRPLQSSTSDSRGKTPAAQTSSVAKKTTTKPAIKIILDCLDDAKALDIENLDINGKSALADRMVIASGRSNRHVPAIADQLLRVLKTAGFKDVTVEGLSHCDWVLVDTGDVIIHIFRPEVRSFYNLEKLWSPMAPVE